MPDKLVQDVMHKGVIACPATLTLPDAARLMTDQNVRALVVTDGACGLCGIIAQSDLVNARVEYFDQGKWKNLTVDQVMTRSVVTVTPSTIVQEAAKLMVSHHIHRIVVVDERDPGTAVGVLSMGDLVRDMMKD